MTSFRYEIDVPLVAECDMLVVGDGSAGSAAAIAAARRGADVVPVESFWKIVAGRVVALRALE